MNHHLNNNQRGNKMTNLNTHKTRVKVQITTIKMINDETNEVSTINEHGKLTVAECKQVASNNGCVFISKDTTTNEHDVLTSDLLDIIK